MPARLDLPPAWKRVPYAQSVVFIGPDWSGVDLKMEIRNLPGDIGTPLISLARTISGEGISTSLYSAFAVPNTDIVAPATELAIRINETTLEALLLASPTSTTLDLYYDLHVGNGVAKHVAMYGRFCINPGVTL